MEVHERVRLAIWKTRWRYFIGMYPEVLEVPLKLDREFLVEKMAMKCVEHEQDDFPRTDGMRA